MSIHFFFELNKEKLKKLRWMKYAYILININMSELKW